MVFGATMRISAVVRNLLQCPVLGFSPNDGRTSLRSWPCFNWSTICWYLSVISSADFLLLFLFLVGPDQLWRRWDRIVEEVGQGSPDQWRSWDKVVEGVG